MNEQPDNLTPLNTTFQPTGEPSAGPRPWRPELSMMPQAGGEPAVKPWRPELQSMGKPAGEPAAEAGLGLTETGGMMCEDEMAMVVGGPNRLRASLSRANLVLFAIFLVGVGVVAFMSLKKGPQSATAADSQAEKKVDTAIEKFLTTHGAKSSKSAKPSEDSTRTLLNDTRKVVDLFLNFASKSQVPLENLRTNPFCFDVTAEAVKSSPQAAAAQKAAEAEKARRAEQAKAAFRKLQLQTVISGPAGRQAMINSVIVKAGDSIDGFKVVDIQDRLVTLTLEDMTFTLEMKY